MSTKEPLQRPPPARHVSATATTNPGRTAPSRHHSHSVSLGSINSTHRVTRRKSTNASAVNNPAALRAALHEMQLATSSDTLSPPKTEADGDASAAAGPASGPNFAMTHGFVAHNPATGQVKGRARRASEGAHLPKTEHAGKRVSGELRCEKCGKGYKHSSCLYKHLWEHDPAWEYTSKLLISKHQQVQLLEAASVLVTMNPGADDEAKAIIDSDASSPSPLASGSSDLQGYYDDETDDRNEVFSSAETTPPPTSDFPGMHMPEGLHTRGKRSSGLSSTYSRSYQSAPSSSLPNANGFGQFYGLSSPPSTSSSSQRRPSSSGLPLLADEEETSLAAAVETLCSFGTPRTAPVLLPADVPPVPPLPARYAEEQQRHQRSQSGNLLSADQLDLASASASGLPSPAYQPLSSERTVKDAPEVNMHGVQTDGLAFSPPASFSIESNLRGTHHHHHHHQPGSKSNDDVLDKEQPSGWTKADASSSDPALTSNVDEEEGVFGGMEGIAHEAHRELLHGSE